jgi:hypothetical protein
MESIARFVMILGVALIVIGAGLYGLAKLNIPLGRLPGDIRIEGQNGSFYFPITTSILVSIILTVLLNVIAKFLKK